MGYAIGGVAVLLVIALVWIGGARKGHDGNADDRHAGRERTRDTREVQAASSRTGEGSVAAKTIDPGMPDAVPLFATPLDTTPGEIAAGTAGTSPVSTGAASTGATTSDSPFTGEDTVPPPPTEAVRIQRVRAPREGDAASIAPGATVQPLDSDLPGLPGVTSPDAELVLQANASRDTWIRVAIDGTRTRSGILPAGESRSWRARNELRVDTGAIEDVTFQLNDRPVDVGEPRTGVGHLLMSWAPAMTDTAGPDSGGAATPDP
jgi:hypothetical protein